MAIPIPPNIEAHQLTVLVSMIIVVALKTVGMYYATKASNPEITFNFGYVVSGIMGVFLGYGAYMTTVPFYDGTLIETFMGAGLFAFGMNLAVDFAGKAIKGTPPAPDPLYSQK